MQLATLITANHNFNKRTTLPSLTVVGTVDDCTMAGDIFCKIFRKNNLFPRHYCECPVVLLQSGLLIIYKSANSGYAIDLRDCRTVETSNKDAYGKEIHKIKLKFSYGRLQLKIFGDEGYKWSRLLCGRSFL